LGYQENENFKTQHVAGIVFKFDVKARKININLYRAFAHFPKFIEKSSILRSNVVVFFLTNYGYHRPSNLYFVCAINGKIFLNYDLLIFY